MSSNRGKGPAASSQPDVTGILTDAQSLRVFGCGPFGVGFELIEYLANGREVKVRLELDDYRMETIYILTRVGRTPLVELVCALQRLIDRTIREAGQEGERLV